MVPPAAPRFQPFETTSCRKRSTKSRSIILLAMAAAVLVAIGSVAGPELWKRYGGVIPGLQNAPAAAESAAFAVPSETKAPIVKTSADANPVEPVASTPVQKAPAEPPVVQSEPPQRIAEAPKTEVRPQRIVRPTLNVGKISAPKMKRSAQMNSSDASSSIAGGCKCIAQHNRSDLERYHASS